MSFSEILPNLYLGNRHAKYCETGKNKFQPTVIISIGCNRNIFPNLVAEYKFSIKDGKESDITPFLTEITSLIDKHIKNNVVFIHCQAGINRSPAIVLAYLCKYHNYTVDQAQSYIKERRPCARFQWHYMKQVEEWLGE